MSQKLRGPFQIGNLTIDEINGVLQRLEDEINEFLVTGSGTETLTNKTLSSPTLSGTMTGGTISGTTLSGAIISGAAPATPVANTVYTDSIVKGWLETSSGGAWTIDDDLNVLSITDNGTGDFTINWATAFSNANYAVGGWAIQAGSPLYLREFTTTAKAAGNVRMKTVGTSDVFGDPGVGVCVIAIGDQ